MYLEIREHFENEKDILESAQLTLRQLIRSVNGI